MQAFYDQLFSAEEGKESPKEWKRQLTLVDLEDLEVLVESTYGWDSWTE